MVGMIDAALDGRGHLQRSSFDSAEDFIFDNQLLLDGEIQAQL